MIVKQIKYYNEDDKQFLNNPVDITAEQLASGVKFKDEGIVCDEIQIKTYPGTVLYLNGEEVIIGEVGVYNILLREGVHISSIQVDPESIEFIKNTALAYFIITFIVHEDTETTDSENSSNGSGQDGSNNDEDSSQDIAEEEIKPNHDSWKKKN